MAPSLFGQALFTRTKFLLVSAFASVNLHLGLLAVTCWKNLGSASACCHQAELGARHAKYGEVLTAIGIAASLLTCICPDKAGLTKACCPFFEPR